MYIAKLLAVVTALTMVFSVATSAQSLAKRHQIEVRVGGWNQTTDSRTEIVLGGVSTTVASNGFVGGLAYGYWLKEELALRISFGVMAASVDAQVVGADVTAEFAAVVPVLLGIRYYYPKSTYGEQLRPFVGIGVGTFIGSQATTRAGLTVTNVARTEGALGGELEAGINVVLDRYVLATAAVAYDLMTDFQVPIGGSSNYSGPQLTLGISLLLGGGRQ